MIISSLRFLDSGRPYGLFQENCPSEKRPVFSQSNWLNLFKNTIAGIYEAHSSVPQANKLWLSQRCLDEKVFPGKVGCLSQFLSISFPEAVI